ncbi:MAG TPA: hypothetical protein VLL52_12860 [Anaerolineae bacterium]|nr:hypothetical protein [Anaerolineae bacterium]
MSEENKFEPNVDANEASELSESAMAQSDELLERRLGDDLRESEAVEVENKPNSKMSPRERKYTLWFIGGAILLLGVCLIAGVLELKFYGGGVWIEDFLVTDEVDEDGNAITGRQNVFMGNEDVFALLMTSGSDSPFTIRWYHEDELLHLQVGRTVDNKLIAYLEGSEVAPLPPGNYRVELAIGPDSEAHRTAYFEVEAYELVLDVQPLQPTPEGHIDIENNRSFIEIPFAFDEVWVINDNEWVINEVKIVIIEDEPLFVIVVDTALAFGNNDEDIAREVALPIAQYGLMNGYYEQAKSLEVNGEAYAFNEESDSIVVTLYNKQLGGGYRVRFTPNDIKMR